MKKVCLNCKKKFRVRNTGVGANAHRKYCYNCDAYTIWHTKNKKRHRSQIDRWGKLHPEERRKHYRRHRLSTKYGLTETGLEAIKKKQRNRCAICRRRFNGRWKKPNVDHDHEKGRGTHRGLLCVDCNLLIGHAFDSIKTLFQAIKYLRRYN